MKIDINSSLNSADTFRTLEGSISSMAKLQTLGGQFAKNNPFELGFLARNDVAGFQKQMNSMLAGTSSLNKMTGEISTSALNMDILREVASATGQDFNNLLTQSKQLAKTQIVGDKLFNFKQEDKDLITNMATFNKTKGVWTVQIGDKSVDVSKIGQTQLDLLKESKKSSEELIKSNQTFDDIFSSTIMDLKSTMLPLLTQLNDALKWLNKNTGALKGVILAGTVLSAGLLAKKAVGGVGSLVGGGIGKMFGSGGGSGSRNPIGPLATSPAATAGNYSFAASVAAIGFAFLSLGAGINLASKGFSEIGKTMSTMKGKQLDGFLSVMKGMAIVVPATILAIGAAATAGAPGLLTFGAASLALGGSIYLASNGISSMSESLAKLGNVNVGKSIMDIGKGMAVMSTSFLNPLFLPSLISQVDLSGISSAFSNINQFSNGNIENIKNLKNLLDSMKNFDSSAFNQLSNSLKNMEFKVKMDGSVPIVINNITNLDGVVLARAVNKTNGYIKTGK
jgi:hypothetical protein